MDNNFNQQTTQQQTSIRKAPGQDESTAEMMIQVYGEYRRRKVPCSLKRYCKYTVEVRNEYNTGIIMYKT